MHTLNLLYALIHFKSTRFVGYLNTFLSIGFMVRTLVQILVFFFSLSVVAQNESVSENLNNQISTNLVLPITGSFDLSYERIVANKWAVGIGAALYGEGFQNLSTYDSYYERITNYEITPFVRIYFNGSQKRSHFLEVFGSLSQVEESGRYLRHVNQEGYGVYSVGSKSFSVGGLGVGYGYRFLFYRRKVVLEAQIGLRTNFDVDFVFLNAAFVRTGIKIGYRF